MVHTVAGVDDIRRSFLTMLTWMQVWGPLDAGTLTDVSLVSFVPACADPLLSMTDHAYASPSCGSGLPHVNFTVSPA